MKMFRIDGVWTLLCADGCVAARGEWAEVKEVMKSWN